MITVKKWKDSRFWAVYDGDKLVCVTVYKKGAEEIQSRLDQFNGEIAAILIRLENGRSDDARQMAELLVGDTDYHALAYEEYTEEFGENGR